MRCVAISSRVHWTGMMRRTTGLVTFATLAFLAMTTSLPVSAATLEGRLLPGAGIAIDGLRAVVTPIDGGESRQATLGPDGRFEFDGLPAGRVAIVVGPLQGGLPEAARVVELREGAANRVTLESRGVSSPAAPTFEFKLYRGEYFDGRVSEEQADLVALTAQGQADNINFDLALGGGTIAGRVTADAGGAGLPGLLVFAFGQSSGALSFDRTDSNGEYRITGIPADAFYVSVNASFFYFNDSDYIGEYYNNSATLFGATPVVVAEGQDVTDINFGLAIGGTVSGRITAESGGAGLGDVTILASGVLPLVVSRLVVTDDAGNYSIRALPPGNYTLRFQPNGGYLEEYYNNRTSEATADPVAVTAGNTTSGIDAALAMGGTITGHIRATGSLGPIPDVIVTATRAGEFFSYQAVTGTDGSYVIEGLATGSYTVGVPELSRWYDNRDEEALADPVAVTAGQTRAGIDITGTVITGGCGVDPQSRVNISGRVTADGQPVEDAEMVLYFEPEESPLRNGVHSPAERYSIGSVSTNANGLYSFECLDVGTYYVECLPFGTNKLPEWYSDSDSAGATALTFIFGGTRGDVDFDLATGGKISGRITTDGSTGLGTVPVYAKNVSNGATYSGYSDTSGNYTIDSGSTGGLPTGNYIVWTEDVSTVNLGYVPIALSRFEAVPAPDGIALEWAPASGEAVGFHVERADSPTGTPVRLTESPVTGRGNYRYLDATARPGRSYAYWLVGIERGGSMERFGPLTASFGEAGITRLLGVFPNPLSSSATVQFSLGTPGRARVQIFDLAGRRVRTLLDAGLPAGASSSAWDGRTESGAEAPAGAYFVRIELGTTVESQKIIVRR